jgi:hypothetical protein
MAIFRPASAYMRQLKDLWCRFNGGSGFPAAICTAGVKTIRGWKAAPTEIFQMTFVLTGYAPNGVGAAIVPCPKSEV